MEVGDKNTWFTECLQLFQFVPYTYTPVTSVRYFTGSEAAAVSAFLSKCKAV